MNQIVVFLFHVYTNIIFFLSSLYDAVFKHNEKEEFFKITGVDSDGIDMSLYYLYGKSYDMDMYPKSIINWKLNGTEYKFILSKDSSEHFPPYSFHTMKHAIPETKIVSAFLKDKGSHDPVTTVGKIVKQYAGPKQNFYRDTGCKIMTSDIWGICDKTLTLITTKGNKDFDLSVDNILEL